MLHLIKTFNIATNSIILSNDYLNCYNEKQNYDERNTG